MNAVFADTFYRIAITSHQDRSHKKKSSFSISTTPRTLRTT